MKLTLETLESRLTPSLTLTNGVLLASGTNKADSYLFNQVGNTLQVTENDVLSTYDITQVKSGVVITGKGNDDVENNTAIPLTVALGKGNDTYVDGTGNDVIDGGKGKDIIYALLGNNTVIANDNMRDRVFVGFTTALYSDDKDQVATFFAPGRTPGSNSIVQEFNVLYITPSNAGSITTVNQTGDNITVTFDGIDSVYSGVTLIAYFGGSGNDQFVNNTSIDTVAYGGVSTGNDILVGGMSFNLLKGGGGNDTIIGRGTYNDLAGNAGSDLLIGFNTTRFRTDANDTFFNAGRF